MVTKPAMWGSETAGTVVVIEDDAQLVQSIDEALARQGYGVHVTQDCHEGIELVTQERPDLVIVDALLASTNGRDGCRRIREVSEAPMLLLGTPGREEDIVQGLEQGGDDYLTKPFGIEELVTRSRVLLRRAPAAAPTREPGTYADEYLTVNIPHRRVMVEGSLVQLTPTEYRLLEYLLENAGRVVAYEQLLQRVWGKDYLDYVDYVRIYVWRLRKKIEKDHKQPRYILTEHGIGYRFETAG